MIPLLIVIGFNSSFSQNIDSLRTKKMKAEIIISDEDIKRVQDVLDKGPIYIYEEKPVINIEENTNKAHYFLTIKSKNNKFNTDSFKFIISTELIEFNKFKEIKSVKKRISVDSILVHKKSDYAKRSPWELHELFSLNKSVNIVFKKGDEYFYYPLLYRGTEKNIGLLAR